MTFAGRGVFIFYDIGISKFPQFPDVHHTRYIKNKSSLNEMKFDRKFITTDAISWFINPWLKT